MKLIRRGWNAAAHDCLKAALCGDDDLIKNEVISKQAVLWQCVGCGWLVTRTEGRELVFVAGAGVNAKAVIKLFMKNRKKLKIESFRVHSERKGMARYLKSLGFNEFERVYKAVM